MRMYKFELSGVKAFCSVSSQTRSMKPLNENNSISSLWLCVKTKGSYGYIQDLS